MDSPQPLRRAAIIGSRWTGIANIINVSLILVTLATVARVLPPEDYGLMAMVGVVLALAAAFVDIGFTSAIIQRQEVTRDQLSSLFWTNCCSGLVVCVLLWVSAPLISSFFREPRIQPLLLWLSPSVVIWAIGDRFATLLQRDLRFRTGAVIQIVAGLAGTVLTIVLAQLNWGVYALVFGQLLNSTTASAISAFVGWRIWPLRLQLRLRDIRSFAVFGAFQMGERFINLLSSNLDYLFIGKVLGPTALGAYTVAYQLVTAPLFRINPIITTVAFPIFSKRQNDSEALRVGYLEISKLVALVTFPILVGVAAAAPAIVPTLLGARWSSSVELVEILAFLGILKSLMNLSGSVLLAKGHADIGFFFNVFIAFGNLITFYLAVTWGTTAVATSYLAISCIYFVPLQMTINRKLGLSWSSYLRALMKIALSAAIMGIAVRLSWNLIEPKMRAGLFSAAILVTIGAIVYCLCVIALERGYIKGLLNMISASEQQ